MSPKNKIKLNLLRKKLDKLDNVLLKIIKKRIFKKKHRPKDNSKNMEKYDLVLY